MAEYHWGSGSDFLRSIQQTADGGYILGGDSFSNASGDKTEDNIGISYGISFTPDFWVVKLEPDEIAGCTMPSLPISISFSTQAVVEWNETDGAVKYRVRYKPVGASEWQYKYASDAKNYVVLKDLLCNTEYQWQIITYCAEDGSINSGYSASSFFTTGACRLSDNNSLPVLNIYPNPNNGEFIIHLSQIYSQENVSIQIRSMLGEEIYSVELNPASEINQSIILGNNTAEGMYLIEILNGNKIFTHQIMIQR